MPKSKKGGENQYPKKKTVEIWKKKVFKEGKRFRAYKEKRKLIGLSPWVIRKASGGEADWWELCGRIGIMGEKKRGVGKRRRAVRRKKRPLMRSI